MANFTNEIEDLTGTVWQFNSNLTAPASFLEKDWDLEGSIVSGDICLGVDDCGVDGDGTELIFYTNNGTGGSIAYTNISQEGLPPLGWSYSLDSETYTSLAAAPYMTILGGGDVTTDSIITWLQANATQIESPTDLTGTTWVFNDPCTTTEPIMYYTENISGIATSGNQTVDNIDIFIVAMSGQEGATYFGHTQEDPRGVFAWYSEMARVSGWAYTSDFESFIACDAPTLTITGGMSTIDPCFKKALEQVATQIGLVDLAGKIYKLNATLDFSEVTETVTYTFNGYALNDDISTPKFVNNDLNVSFTVSGGTTIFEIGSNSNLPKFSYSSATNKWTYDDGESNTVVETVAPTLKIMGGSGASSGDFAEWIASNSTETFEYVDATALRAYTAKIKNTMQAKLVAGSNITITGSTISATDTTYTASNGIDITNNVISNTGVLSINGATGAITNIATTSEVANKLDATKCTYQTTAPTSAISDGGVHIVYLTEEPTTKYSGYIYMIAEA